jgi:hypothetical protein
MIGFACNSPIPRAVDTGGKFATGVNDTGGKFATDVNHALPPVSTTPAANNYQTADNLK